MAATSRPKLTAPRSAPPPPAELVDQAAELLQEDGREQRLRAAQLLARGYALSEELRQAELREPIDADAPPPACRLLPPFEP